MTVDEFAKVLADEIEADGGDTAFVDSLICRARAAIKNGKGELRSLLASGINGKSFSSAVHLNAAEVLDACRQALRIAAGTDDRVSATYPDFSGLH